MTNTSDLFKPLRVKDFIRSRAGDGENAPTTWLRVSYIAHLFTHSCAIFAQTSDGIDAPAYTLAQYANEEDAEIGLLDLMKNGLTDNEQSEEPVVAAPVPAPAPSHKPVAVARGGSSAGVQAPGSAAQAAPVDDDIMNVGLFDKLTLNKRASVT